MMLSPTDLGILAGAMTGAALSGWTRLRRLQDQLEGKLSKPWMPESADTEYRDLYMKASTPWLAFVRDAIAQGCRVSGYTSEELWLKVWQANGFDGRQSVVTREAVGLGRSFVLVMPDDEGGVSVRPLSVLDTVAVFDDPWDVYPSQVLHRLSRTPNRGVWEGEWYYIDTEAAYRFSGTPKTPLDVRGKVHGLGYTPVVQITNTLDQVPQSSVAAAVPIYKRIVDATFTLQMGQRYGAFPQKWMKGGTLAKDENGRALVNPSVDSLLHAEGEDGESAGFGTFAATDLIQIVTALDAHIKHLSAVTQVPPHYLLGAVVNMSAEGIAAAESGYHRNISERKTSLGEGWGQVMGTAAQILGIEDAPSNQVEWENVSAWSLNQVADAITKLSSVGADKAMLFQLIPGWTKTDAIEAAATGTSIPLATEKADIAMSPS